MAVDVVVGLNTALVFPEHSKRGVESCTLRALCRIELLQLYGSRAERACVFISFAFASMQTLQFYLYPGNF